MRVDHFELPRKTRTPESLAEAVASRRRGCCI